MECMAIKIGWWHLSGMFVETFRAGKSFIFLTAMMIIVGRESGC